MEDIIEKALAYAKSCHEGDCSGHDFFHILRVLANTRRILAETPEADSEAALLAAVLHDVDDYKLGGNGGKAECFLRQAGVSAAMREKVLRIIAEISFSKSGSAPRFEMVEQKIVSDADKLDAMGAIGVCRTVMYSAATGRVLFDAEAFPKENLTLSEYKDKTRCENHAVNHFFDKLLKLKGAMQTDAGRKEAARRHRFMVSFLSEFFIEVEAPQWLAYLEKYEKV